MVSEELGIEKASPLGSEFCGWHVVHLLGQCLKKTDRACLLSVCCQQTKPGKERGLGLDLESGGMGSNANPAPYGLLYNLGESTVFLSTVSSLKKCEMG